MKVRPSFRLLAIASSAAGLVLFVALVYETGATAIL